MKRLLAGSLAAVSAVAALAGCAGSSVGASGDQGFVGGSGALRVVDTGDRKVVGAIAGPTLTGDRASLRDLRGKVVVVNVWGSWCAPCRGEAPLLAKAARQLEPRGVRFLGINTRDTGPAAGRAFDRRYGVPYPSIFDPGGETLLAFHGSLPPRAIPTTVVIDRRGRLAAAFTGQLTSRSTLVDVVEDVAKGSA